MKKSEWFKKYDKGTWALIIKTYSVLFLTSIKNHFITWKKYVNGFIKYQTSDEYEYSKYNIPSVCLFFELLLLFFFAGLSSQSNGYVRAPEKKNGNYGAEKIDVILLCIWTTKRATLFESMSLKAFFFKKKKEKEQSRASGSEGNVSKNNKIHFMLQFIDRSKDK